MKRSKLIALMLLFSLCLSVLPATQTKAAATVVVAGGEEDYDDEVEADLDDMEEEEDDEFAGEFTKYDLQASPAKKTIKIGKSFYINIIPADESEWEDLPDEEWDEICEENIDSITFRSSKSSVASVNKTTGKVKGKKKGSAVISTTINLANGESVTYRTKVYVVK